MPPLGFVQLLSFAVGITTAILVFLFRRIGRASWFLALLLLPLSLSSGAMVLRSLQSAWPTESLLRFSFGLIVVAAPLGYLVSFTVGREDRARLWPKRSVSTILTMVAAAVGFVWIWYSMPPDLTMAIPPGDFALGPGAYFCALYLVLVSVVVLANLEQTLRSAPEGVRWEIKFLLLGLAGMFGCILYIGSKVLLFSPRVGLISFASLQIFPILFLISCLLILVSWRRSSGRWKVSVSQGFIYSTITLTGAGIYLIISSLAARWAGQWGSQEVSLEAMLFLLLLLSLAVILLWTDFRHRAKHWIRRNLLAGKYDYRQYWIEASDRIRALDATEAAAEALADIAQKAVGAIDVSVWLRMQNPVRLKLVGMLGNIGYASGTELFGIVEKLFDVDKPTPVKEFDNAALEKLMPELIAKTNTSVVVPLHSGGRVVGLLTVGPDRSGQPYDWDALEFLGVLGRYAAGEFHKTDLLATLVEAKESEVFRTFSTFLLHDLKNFASTLSLIARNASQYRDNPDFQRDAFQSVFETAEKMKKLCNSLRAFSGAVPVNKKICDLNHIVRTVADNFSGDHSHRLILDLVEVPPVFVDAEEIERVLRNLLLNAREAMPSGGTITLRTRSKADQVELAVEDDGPGMGIEFIEKELFVPFHTTKSEGLGIGLYQSKKIVEAHNGTIKVESQEGSGTTVHLWFPLAEVSNVSGG